MVCAAELDPGFSGAFMGLATVGYWNVLFGDAESPEETLAGAFTAVSLDDKDAMAHWILGRVYTQMGESGAAVADPELARTYSHVRDYPRFNQAAVREMHRQVGDLVLDQDGLAPRGLLVRHPVLPDGIAGTEEVMRFLAEEISTETDINVMDQYRPCFKAERSPGVERALTTAEFDQAVAIARRYGLGRLDHRAMVSRFGRVL